MVWAWHCHVGWNWLRALQPPDFSGKFSIALRTSAVAAKLVVLLRLAGRHTALVLYTFPRDNPRTPGTKPNRCDRGLGKATDDRGIVYVSSWIPQNELRVGAADFVNWSPIMSGAPSHRRQNNVGSILLTPQENESLFNHLGRKCIVSLFVWKKRGKNYCLRARKKQANSANLHRVSCLS